MVWIHGFAFVYGAGSDIDVHGLGMVQQGQDVTSNISFLRGNTINLRLHLNLFHAILQIAFEAHASSHSKYTLGVFHHAL